MLVASRGFPASYYHELVSRVVYGVCGATVLSLGLSLLAGWFWQSGLVGMYLGFVTLVQRAFLVGVLVMVVLFGFVTDCVSLIYSRRIL